MPVNERDYMGYRCGTCGRPANHADPCRGAVAAWGPDMPARDRINWFKVSCWLFATLVLVAGGKVLVAVSFLWALFIVFLLCAGFAVVVIRWLMR